MMPKSVFTDHRGKTSQGRVAALVGTLTACVLAAAPLWSGPTPDLEILLVLLGVPGGLTLWQKMAAPMERTDG